MVLGSVDLAAESGASFTAFWIAAGGAVVGALLAMLYDLLREWAQVRRVQARLISRLQLEIDEVAGEARARTRSEQALPIRPPLDTSAWDNFRHSPATVTVEEGRGDRVARFYRLVDHANYLASSSLELLAISASAASGSTKAGQYAQEATRLATEPCQHVVEAYEAAHADASGFRPDGFGRYLKG